MPAKTDTAVSPSIPVLSPADLARLGEIALALGRAGIGVALRQGALVVLDPVDRLPKATVGALREAFEELGPAFLKLGQFIASSPGLFPDVFVDEFRKVLDDVSPEKPDSVARVLSLSFGQDVTDIFDEFDWEPIAAASIAQVHRARLRDGREVAVKIRRPGLRRQIRRDMRVLSMLAYGLAMAGPLSQAIDFQAVLEDFEATLLQELDLSREAASMRIFGQNLQRSGISNVICPEPVDDLVTERVLVMTFVDGLPLSALLKSDSAPLPGQPSIGVPEDLATELLREGVKAWYRSVVVDGFFHGDVHAGNIFFTTDNKVALLDFGIVGSLDDRTRIAIREMVEAMLVRNDFPAVLRALIGLGVASTFSDIDSAIADLSRVIEPLKDTPLEDISYGQVIVDLLKLARRYRLRLPRELALLAKQLLYFEAYAKKLAPHYRILGDTEIWDIRLEQRRR
jgi:ubiquinone biosynthesis protein